MGVGNHSKRVTDKLASSSDWHMLVPPVLTGDHLEVPTATKQKVTKYC